MFYIYILYSVTADLYYTGYSADPFKRLEQHRNSDIDKFTGKYSDWNLVAVFRVSNNAGDALRLERFIKKQKSRMLIEKLIDLTFTPTGILAQLVRVPHLRD